MKHTLAFALTAALAVGSVSAQIANFTPTLDGTVDGGYGSPIAVQTVQTQFGNVTSGLLGPGGGEFDALYAAQDGTNLYLMIAGNQEANGNNCYVLIDNNGESGGDSGTLGDVPGGDDFSNAGLFSNDAIGGASLPAGFNVDLGIQFKHFNNGSVGTGDSLEWRSTAADYTTDSIVLDTTNPTDLSTGADANVDASFVATDSGLTYAVDNSNVAGVMGGTAAADQVAAAAVTTGIELAIPFSLIPGTVDASSTLEVLVFYSSGDGQFASNQFLPGVPSTPQDNVGTNEDWVALGLSPASLPFQAPVLPYSNTFDDATSGDDFLVLDTFGNNTVGAIQADPNTNIVFGGDYSAVLGAGAPVPEAPSTPGGAAATSGVIIQGNLTDATSGVMVFWNQDLSVDFRASFDYFDAYNGGGGSTEDLWVGVNATGTLYNAETNDNGGKDGYVFVFYGDYDVAGSDARFGEGNPAGTGPDDNYIPNKDSGSSLDLPNDGVLTGVRWGDGLEPDDNARDIETTVNGPGDTDGDALVDLFTNAMPNSVDSGGAPRPGGTINAWTTVQVQYIGGQLTISLNGVQFLTYNDVDDTFPSGLLMFGHEDVFSSISTNHTGVFDNFEVEEVLQTSVGGYSLYR